MKCLNGCCSYAWTAIQDTNHRILRNDGATHKWMSFAHGQYICEFCIWIQVSFVILDYSNAELYDIATARNVKRYVHKIDIKTFKWISFSSIKQKLYKIGTCSKYNYNATQTAYAKRCHQNWINGQFVARFLCHFRQTTQLMMQWQASYTIMIMGKVLIW